MKKLQILVLSIFLTIVTMTEQIFSSGTSAPTPKPAAKKAVKIMTEEKIWETLKKDKKQREIIQQQLQHLIKKEQDKEKREKLEKTLIKVDALEKVAEKKSGQASQTAKAAPAK